MLDSKIFARLYKLPIQYEFTSHEAICKHRKSEEAGNTSCFTKNSLDGYLGSHFFVTYRPLGRNIAKKYCI